LVAREFGVAGLIPSGSGPDAWSQAVAGSSPEPAGSPPRQRSGSADTGYFQDFALPGAARTDGVLLPEGLSWKDITLRNVIGVLPGEGGEGASCVVIGAHYDHLGVGPQGPFTGADDNASGVAILLELAGRLRLEGPFRNHLVFAAFSGEELGLLGSRHYLGFPACPIDRTLAMINLDTVGRMQDDKLYIFGQGSAEEFTGLLKGINLGADLDLVTPEAGPFASDQVPFHEKGIPVLHLFTGPNADYHRAGDTADKLSYNGMSKVLDFAFELAVWLGDRPEKLHFVPPGAMSAKPAVATAGGPARSVSLGTIPDFGRESGGVLLTGTMPGSPAEGAGLQAGDIIVAIDDTAISNLADLSAALKGHQPGDSVTVSARRGDGEIRRRVALVARR
jgi:hypothetical protein